MLRLGQVLHQSQQAESRRSDRPAQWLIVESFQLEKQGGAMEIQLLRQRLTFVSYTIRS